jgi:hypothetical protein
VLETSWFTYIAHGQVGSRLQLVRGVDGHPDDPCGNETQGHVDDNNQVGHDLHNAVALPDVADVCGQPRNVDDEQQCRADESIEPQKLPPLLLCQHQIQDADAAEVHCLGREDPARGDQERGRQQYVDRHLQGPRACRENQSDEGVKHDAAVDALVS